MMTIIYGTLLFVAIVVLIYIAQKDQGIEPVFAPAILGNEDGVHAWGVKNPSDHK